MFYLHTVVDSNSDFHSVTIPQIDAQNINNYRGRHFSVPK